MKDEHKTVALLSAQHITREKIENAIRLAGGLQHVKKYAIKPNLCSIRSPPVTTRIEVVRYVIEYINKLNSSAEIFIVESDATSLNVDVAFKRLGYTKLEREFSNINLINLSKDYAVKVEVNGNRINTLTVPLTLFEADALINLAQLKTHVLYGVSLGMKNLFGLIPHKEKIVFHPFLEDIIVDLSRFYNPDLTIIDGVQGLEGRGPIDGDIGSGTAIIASRDVLSADIVASRYMGFRPEKIRYLSLAKKRLGNQEIDLIGDETSRQFRFVKGQVFISLGLRISRFGLYVTRLGEALTFIGNVFASVDKKTLKQKISYRDAIPLFKRMIMKLDI